MAGWVFIIFGLPAMYVLLWGLVLVAPWVLVVLGSLSGPLLALAIPFELLSYNFYNPVEMWSGIKRSMRKGPYFYDIRSIFRILDPSCLIL